VPRGESPLQSETPQGTLDMLVLRVLVMGPAHGHTIAHAIERGSEDVLQIEHGSLYLALHRLENRGWVASCWGTAGDNHRARHYRLTSAGRKPLLVQLTGREHASLVHVWLGVSIALALSARPSAQMAEEERPTVEVATDDRSSAGAELGTARARAKHIFAHAGIRVVWRTQAGGGIAETGTHRIQLVVLSGFDADEMFLGHGDLLGIAVLSISRVYIHYDRVLALARQSRTPPGWFLGVVIAHEIAHVLRPDAGHAENGLMAATLRPEATPMFTAQEAQALRVRLHDGVTVTALGAR
jgi:PadR family transcriptional regulator PadR